MVLVAIALILYIVYKIGKSLLKIIAGIIINSVLGIVVIYIVDTFLNMGIPWKIYTLIPVALFGLPAAGTLMILRFFGIPL